MRRQGPGRNSRFNQYPQRTGQYASMLNMRRLDDFKYDATEILRSSPVDEHVWFSMLSSIVAKASRSSIKDAQDFIIQKRDEKVLPPETAEALHRLLERYRKWR